MTYDAAATRARLIDAAYAEFVEKGLAGARVDRIAANAPANKQAIYLYFGSKDGLFDAVLESRLRSLANLVHFSPTDLSGYFGAIFDHLSDDPGLLRLVQWRNLERPSDDEAEVGAHLDKAAQIAATYGVPIDTAMDVLMSGLAVAQAWVNTPSAIRNPLGEKEDVRRGQHRAAMLKSAMAASKALLLQ